MKTNEDKSVETAKFHIKDIDNINLDELEQALHLCYKLGYLEGQRDMEMTLNPISSKT